MLINLRNALMTGKRLPYDAEVEYLESTGTQWIDTGVAGQSGIDLDYGFSCTSVGNQAQAIGGCYTVLQSLYVGLVRTNGYFAYHYGNTTDKIVQVQQVAANTYYHVQAHLYNGEQYYILNGNKSAVGTIAGNFVSPLNIHLFRINASATTYSNGVRIYALKIYVNGVLVRDYIPVRKGTVGYLYDRVSGKLFGNAGTGDFVLGPDVVPVEYLQSSGTQWIDTGVVPAANDTYTVETRKNNASQDNASFGLAGCVYCFSNGFAGTGYGTFWGHPAVGLGGTAEVNPLGDTDWHTIVASPTSVSIDGVALGYRTSDAQSPRSTVKLFARGNNFASGGVAKQYNGMISHVFVNRGGLDLRKFYAVRVGTDTTSWEGAMMDVLTRRIYRNAGTGAFTYGNDLNYPIPA